MANTEIGAKGYKWASVGDVNAFFGLMLDNVGGMILTTSLLVGVFGFPADFVLTRMMPGTALGVLVGDLMFSAMAFRLSKKTGRGDVTAMPLGLDTPSIFGTVLLVVGPAFAAAKGRGMEVNEAATHAWHIGIAMLMASGVFKLLCAPLSGWVRRVVPRAGLLGSLAAIALVIISFFPLMKIAAQPVAGFAAMTVILACLTAGWRLPKGIPGALGAVIVGAVVYYGMDAVSRAMGWSGPAAAGETLGAGGLRFALPFPMPEWWEWLSKNGAEAAGYLAVTLPLALATVIGGIDCTESAAAAGDEYHTGWVIGVEGLATIVAGAFGGIIQTTPYIGHPAYKAMGGRAAYTMATAAFVGAAGMLGIFGWIFWLVPEAVILPILVFIALEITSQSFHATTPRHYPALAIACVPALAFLVKVPMDQVLGDPGLGAGFGKLSLAGQQVVQTITMLSGGFILTSLLWATALARLIDGRARDAAVTLGIGALLSVFGVIHSGLPSSPTTVPWDAIGQLKALGRFEASRMQTPYHWAAAYGLMGLLVIAIGRWGTGPADGGGRGGSIGDGDLP